MKMVNIHEMKARLSEMVDAVERGERIVVCRRNRAVAELRPIAAGRTGPRPLGGTAIEVPPAFFAPLPGDLLDAFYGDAGDAAPPSRVAERRPAYRASRKPAPPRKRR